MKRVLESRRERDDRGAVLVEMALVLPLLALLLMVVIDLGLVIQDHQVLQNAAREGARVSSLPDNWISPINPVATEADIKQHVIDYLQGEGITVSAGSITIDQNYPIPVGALTPFGSEVTITYNRPLLIQTGWLPVTELTLTGRAVFRNFY